MIKISLLYPHDDEKRFDVGYYVNTHAPWARKLMGSALKGFEIEQGVSSLEPGSKPTCIAAAHLYFDTVEDFKSSYGPDAAEIQADIPNYTDIQPVRQVSNVKDSDAPNRT